MRVINHLRALWGDWWFVAFGPALFLVGFALAGAARIEIVVVIVVISALAMGTSRSRDFLIAAAPGIAIALGYEVVRYLRPIFVTSERVLACQLRELDVTLFSFGLDTSLPEFFAAHHAPFWDVFFAIPYVAFWVIAVAFATTMFFLNRAVMNRYLWLLAATHLVAFVIWLTFPAAPPWYVALKGCAIDLEALPSAAALLRVDALFGMSYFQEFYSRGPTVFGALPSLHCAFPVVGLLAAWPFSGWRVRAVHLVYALWMLGASVYLEHHWLLDGVLSIAIVLMLYFGGQWLLPKVFVRRDPVPKASQFL